MPLPIPGPLPTATATVAGQKISFRALSRLEWVRLRSMVASDPEADTESYVIARATGCTEDEARTWLGQVDDATGGELLRVILELTLPEGTDAR